MLWYIRGQLKYCFPQHVIVDVMGLGLQAYIPASSYFKLPDPGKDIILYTYLHPKEDSFTLYGFLESQERDFFVRLLGVGGIGPKVALSLIGHLTISQIVNAVINDDASIFTTIPGIGSKTANRIIYELNEKLDTVTVQAYLGEGPSTKNVWIEVYQALTALGYSDVEISRAKKKLPSIEETSVEDLFKKSLVLLSKE